MQCMCLYVYAYAMHNAEDNIRPVQIICASFQFYEKEKLKKLQ
jgi:hypothetical protein